LNKCALRSYHQDSQNDIYDGDDVKAAIFIPEKSRNCHHNGISTYI